MKAIIEPSFVRGIVTAPPSKSMAHRLIICAGLAQGESRIDNVSYSEDILATVDCLISMGATVDKGEDYLIIKGTNDVKTNSGEFHCRESGSTLRFFVPLAMLSTDISRFYGSVRLMERPMSVYESIAHDMNLHYKTEKGCLAVSGELKSGFYSVPANISSQFISGLLFALSLCSGDSEIELTGTVESRSYIDMTIEAMRLYGVKIEWKSDNILYVKGNQQYKPTKLTVEGDYSNAAFFDAFNYIGGEVCINGLSDATLQGDSVYKEYFKALRKGSPELDIKNCPDLAPVLMALAAELNGARLTGTSRLKIKESDRGEAMRQELSKLGADIELFEDEIIINKAILKKPDEILCSHNDHRVVMSLTMLLSKYGGVIEGAQAVTKSYPDFFEKAEALGLEVKQYDN